MYWNLCALATLFYFLILIFNFWHFLITISGWLAGPAKVMTPNFGCVLVVNILQQFFGGFLLKREACTQSAYCERVELLKQLHLKIFGQMTFLVGA